MPSQAADLQAPGPCVQRLGRALIDQGKSLATAESCTGGLVGHYLTSVPGSSTWYQGGVIAYAQAVKCRVLGVTQPVLAAKGAVSQGVVEAMVYGLVNLLQVECALAVSGIAGPGGGSQTKPVGTVWMAWQDGQTTWSGRFCFAGSRQEIKHQAAVKAVEEMLAILDR